MSDCPFCQPEPGRVLLENDLVVAIRDGFPVTEGHTLIISRRHCPDYFSASEPEKRAIWAMVEQVKDELQRRYAPEGFNVGFNAGEAAGQTVMHLHVHVIPRRLGDVQDPRGGVRGVIPAKQRY